MPRFGLCVLGLGLLELGMNSLFLGVTAQAYDLAEWQDDSFITFARSCLAFARSTFGGDKEFSLQQQLGGSLSFLPLVNTLIQYMFS
jgi:hypothetical protein